MGDRDRVVNYEVDEQEAIDEVENEIEFLDQDYIEDKEEEQGEVQVKSPEEAQAHTRIEQLRERLEGGESSTAAAMKEVVETLKGMRTRPADAQTEQGIEDLQELRKKLAAGFYDDPMGAVDTWVDKRLSRYEKEKLEPAFNQMAGVLRDTTLDGSKRAATADETGKFVMDKYASEVEELVTSGQVQIGPGAYKSAINRVASDHIDELLDWKIEQRDLKKSAELGDEALRRPGRNANPSSAGAPPSPDGRVQVTRTAQAAIYAMADRMSVDREQFYQSYVRNHPEEVRKMNRR